ncbi:glycerophosphodiester phosphodiesterase family protein [Roseivirga pacifica]|uniref:glycerophosphodiester phosphodiesterase family protein n=1 Tax=Roseivirga pacifica TaxID=1267423 RepID=UPI003BAE8CE7
MKYKITFLLHLLVLPAFCQQNTTEFAELITMMKQPKPNYVMVVAHRGDWRNFPENSLAAIQSCIDMGVDMVEIDVAFTRDGVPVLMHDKTLDRTTTGKGAVSSKTFAQLKMLRLRDGLGRPTDHEIPTLEEALVLCKGRILVNLDKAENRIPDLYPLLLKTGTIDQVALGSYKAYEEISSVAGDYLKKINYMPKIKDNSRAISAYLEQFEDSLNFSVLQVRFESETAATVEYLNVGDKYSSWIWVNTITANRSANHHDDRAVTDLDGSYGWLIERGVNMMQTDRPQLLLNYLRQRNLHR